MADEAVKLPDMRTKANRDLLELIRDRYKVMSDFDDEMRELAISDMEFANVPGSQWDENMKQERGKRPCYEVNKTRIKGKRIINDMRANRPSVKVRPTEGGDKKIAEINEGLIRNIWSVSDGDTVIDYAAEYQVNGGMTAWRISTEYADDMAFDQDICIKPIQNPFCLYADPACKDLLKRDADDWILTDRLSKKAFEARYPGAEKVDWDETSYDDDTDWEDEEGVRVVEYWYKKPVTKEIWLVPITREDGSVENQVVDSTSDEAEGIDPASIVRRRKVRTDEIYWCIASGQRILEGPTKWAGRQFPFVMVFGEFIVIKGKVYWWGIPRFARDAQQSYNIAYTSINETIAQSPKSKWWATAEQAKGLTAQWAEAHKKNLPFMLYNPDGKAPGPPSMMLGPQIPTGLVNQLMIADQDLKDVTGVYDSSIGAEGDEKSGRAIYARQQQGEIVNFNYPDNMVKGVQRTYEILLDLIPEIYDTERELRVLGKDGKEDYVTVNQIVTAKDGSQVRVHDLSVGKYDVNITVGPSFATLRQEAAELYGNLGQKFPALMEVAGDIIFKSMDLPYAEDIAERLETLLPPQIQELLNKDTEVPPEVQRMMRQVQAAMQQVQQHGQLVQAAAQELEEQKAVTEKEQAQLKAIKAEIDTAQAEFDAHIAQEFSKLVKMQADLTVKASEVRDADAVTERLESVDQAVSQFMQVIDKALESLNQRSEAVQNRTIRIGEVKRKDGKLTADVELSDGTRRTIRAVREKGGLKLVESDSEAGSEA